MFTVQAGQKIGQKSAKEPSNGHGRFILGCSLVSKDTPKLFLGLYLIHKRPNVKFKIYLELSYFFATQPSLTGHHGRHRPYIHIRPTPAGQQLPNLKSQEFTALYLPYKKNGIEKTRGGGLSKPPSPRSVRVNILPTFKVNIFTNIVYRRRFILCLFREYR